MSQIPLSLILPQQSEVTDFFVTGANALAYGWLQTWPNWPAPYQSINIYGPKGCGKTHLSSLYQQKSKSCLITSLSIFDRDDFGAFDSFVCEDVSTSHIWDEEALFHLLNYLAETGKTCFFTSQVALSQMDWQLPDLKSRMRSLPSQTVELPDDELLLTLLDSYFQKRQIQVAEPTLRYILSRIERSYEALTDIVQQVDKLSLAEKRAVTTSLIRRLFENKESHREIDNG